MHPSFPEGPSHGHRGRGFKPKERDTAEDADGFTPAGDQLAGHTSRGLHLRRRAAFENSTVGLPGRAVTSVQRDWRKFWPSPCISAPVYQGGAKLAHLKPAAHSALISSVKVMTASGSDGVAAGAGSPCLRPAGRLSHRVLCPWTVGFLSLCGPWAECGQLWAAPSFLHSIRSFWRWRHKTDACLR